MPATCCREHPLIPSFGSHKDRPGDAVDPGLRCETREQRWDLTVGVDI